MRSAHHDPQLPVPRWVEVVCWLGIAGVGAYVAAWVFAGRWYPGYDAREQAISELFAIGAPTPGRWLVVGSLVVSGIALIGFAAAMHRGLPGRGLSGPLAAGYGGVMTVLVAAAPCTEGCPGVDAGGLDTVHAVIAGTGYTALLLAPLLTARRIWPATPTLAVASVVLGAAASLGFAARYLGVIDGSPGLQQRLFNTIADAWFVVIAVWLIVRARANAPDRDAVSSG